MTTRVEPEEVEALHGAVEDDGARPAAPAEVAQRDFKQPRRMSGATLTALAQRLERGLPALEQALRSFLKRPLRCGVEELREASAEGLLDGVERPLALGSFTVAGQPAWIRWDPRAAVTAIEALLGSSGNGARELSEIECVLLARVFELVLDGVQRPLGLKTADLAVARSLDDVPTWRDGAAGAEPHRLCVSIAVESGEDTSRFHVYLPGFAEAPQGEAERDASLPEHLELVEVELAAHLGASDVPLADLLAIEVGDVISLGTTLSEPLVLRVEGQACGTALMGSLRGVRAVRVLQVDPPLVDLV